MDYCFWNKDLFPETLWTKKKTHGPEQRPSGLNQRPSNTTTTHTPPSRSVMVSPGSEKVFLGSGIWPKFSACFGKMQNILTGKGIRLLSGKRDPPKSGHGKRDYLNVCWEILGSSSKCDSTRWAFSGVSYQSKLYSVNKNWPRLSSNNYKQTSRLKPHFYNWMPGMSLWS